MGEIIELLKGEDGAVWSALLRTRLKANIVQKHSQTNQIVIPYPLEIKSKTKDNISKKNTDDKTDISMKHTMNTKNLGAADTEIYMRRIEGQEQHFERRIR